MSEKARRIKHDLQGLSELELDILSVFQGLPSGEREVSSKWLSYLFGADYNRNGLNNLIAKGWISRDNSYQIGQKCKEIKILRRPSHPIVQSAELIKKQKEYSLRKAPELVEQFNLNLSRLGKGQHKIYKIDRQGRIYSSHLMGSDNFKKSHSQKAYEKLKRKHVKLSLKVDGKHPVAGIDWTACQLSLLPIFFKKIRKNAASKEMVQFLNSFKADPYEPFVKAYNDFAAMKPLSRSQIKKAVISILHASFHFENGKAVKDGRNETIEKIFKKLLPETYKAIRYTINENCSKGFLARSLIQLEQSAMWAFYKENLDYFLVPEHDGFLCLEKDLPYLKLLFVDHLNTFFGPEFNFFGCKSETLKDLEPLPKVSPVSSKLKDLKIDSLPLRDEDFGSSSLGQIVHVSQKNKKIGRIGDISSHSLLVTHFTAAQEILPLPP